MNLLDIPDDCLNEINGILDHGSKLVFRLVCLRVYQLFPKTMLTFDHKHAALVNGHLSHLKMFRELGMNVLDVDISMINPDSLECINWFFANIETSVDESIVWRTLFNISESKNPACLIFLWEQFGDSCDPFISTIFLTLLRLSDKVPDAITLRCFSFKRGNR